MNILFICTGNTCRSPMAEGYLKSLGIKDLSVSSAGIYANGEKVSSNSVTAMQDIGVDISSHISRPLTLEMVEKSSKIYTMTASHKAILIQLGIDKDKLFTLDEVDIIDPFGSDISAYRKCRSQITNAIDKIFNAAKKEVLYLEEKDAKDIAILEELCFSTPWSEKTITDSIKNKNIFMGIKENENLIGYLSMYQSLGEGYINNIAVNKDYRRRGIGKALLSALMDFCIEAEFEFITLEVRESNIPAISLYNSFGFKEEGRRKNYYNAPCEDAIILTRRFK